MHSFVSALFVAALATLNSAAPVGIREVSPAVSVSVPPSDSIPAHTLPVEAPISSGEGDVKSVGETVNARDSVSNLPSVPVIFNSILTEVQPFADQLTYLAPSNCTINEITTAVASIKSSITTAIPQLQALVGQASDIIMAPVDTAAGEAKLTVDQVANTVGRDVLLIFDAAGHVLDVVSTQGGEVVANAKNTLVDLGGTVSSLVNAVEVLVDGLSVHIAPVVEPIESVISELDLGDLAIALGLKVHI